MDPAHVIPNVWGERKACWPPMGEMWGPQGGRYTEWEPHSEAGGSMGLHL